MFGLSSQSSELGGVDVYHNRVLIGRAALSDICRFNSPNILVCGCVDISNLQLSVSQLQSMRYSRNFNLTVLPFVVQVVLQTSLLSYISAIFADYNRPLPVHIYTAKTEWMPRCTVETKILWSELRQVNVSNWVRVAGWTPTPGGTEPQPNNLNGNNNSNVPQAAPPLPPPEQVSQIYNTNTSPIRHASPSPPHTPTFPHHSPLLPPDRTFAEAPPLLPVTTAQSSRLLVKLVNPETGVVEGDLNLLVTVHRRTPEGENFEVPETGELAVVRFLVTDPGIAQGTVEGEKTGDDAFLRALCDENNGTHIRVQLTRQRTMNLIAPSEGPLGKLVVSMNIV
eukprot:c13653_g1_i1.p2 GENE.c13653_g1_i1~~c13653_g1_i1.p2  ORF type:complete len:338 (+),score=79.01 c13653_g1_i1:1026-2039(+)